MVSSPFMRVYTRYLVASGGEGTCVYWEFTQEFDDPLPHTFQLEGAAGAAPETAEFTPIGLPQTNTFRLVDPGAEIRRSIGGDIDFQYRVRLTTPRGEYVTKPVGTPDSHDYRAWRLGRDTIRKER